MKKEKFPQKFRNKNKLKENEDELLMKRVQFMVNDIIKNYEIYDNFYNAPIGEYTS